MSSTALEVINEFERRSRLKGLEVEMLSRPDGDLLLIFVGNPTDRLFRILQEVQGSLALDHPFRERVTLRKTARKPWLTGPETRLLQKVLSESLTVDMRTFEDDFFSRYIKSVFGAEDQIESSGNHVVFGRRGSGKSSLLLYAMRKLHAEAKATAWVAMQTYDRRKDPAVIAGVVAEILAQVKVPASHNIALDDLETRFHRMLESPEQITLDALRLIVPALKKLFMEVAKSTETFTIFLDDFHVISQELQPELLSLLYAFSRGNKVFLKISSIEHFSRIWDPANRAGLEVPNDAQVIRLDYNLTEPAKSRSHIENILTAHAHYCGLPSVGVVAGSGALSRLVWVAAGVPRDAINMFAQGIVRAVNRGEKAVSVTSINISASEAANDKMRFVDLDSSGSFKDARATLELVKDFCIKQQKKNAFLVEIQNDDPTFEAIRKLIDLRLLHVLNPGITPDEAGVRWMVLLLDYGFYTGMRAAKNIDLFQDIGEKETLSVRELRKLPRFRPAAASLP